MLIQGLNNRWYFKRNTEKFNWEVSHKMMWFDLQEPNEKLSLQRLKEN